MRISNNNYLCNVITRNYLHVRGAPTFSCLQVKPKRTRHTSTSVGSSRRISSTCLIIPRQTSFRSHAFNFWGSFLLNSRSAVLNSVIHFVSILAGNSVIGSTSGISLTIISRLTFLDKFPFPAIPGPRVAFKSKNFAPSAIPSRAVFCRLQRQSADHYYDVINQ